MRAVNHLTLTTGHNRLSPRSEVRDETIKSLKPLVDVGRMEFPHLGIQVSVVQPERADQRGTACFQIGPITSGISGPYVIGFCCWKDEMSEIAWQATVQYYRAQRVMLGEGLLYREPQDDPPQAPWLAIIITPYMLGLDKDRTMMLGDLERCVFWTLAEGA